MFRISRCEENVKANTCIHVTFLCCWYISLLFTLERIHASNIGLLTAVKPGNKKAFVFFPKQIPKSYCSVEFVTKYLLGLGKTLTLTLLKKFRYSEFFWSVFSRIRTEYGEIGYLSVLSPNARKYGPQKLRTRTLFTQHNKVLLQVDVGRIGRNWFMF